MSALPVLNVFPRRHSKRRRPARRSDARSFSRLRRSRSAVRVRLATSPLALGTALAAALFVVAPSFESPRLAVFAQTTQTTETTQTEDALLAAALEQHGAGNYAEAIQNLETFIAQYPSSPHRNKAELFLGHARLAFGEFSDPQQTALARSHFQYIINQGQNAEYYKEATFHNAHSYFNLRQYSEARPLFTKFLTEFPNDGYVEYVYYYLGVCEAQSGAYSAALNYFDRQLTDFPNSFLRWTCRLEKAATVGKSGDYQEAEKQLNALAADPAIPADVAGQVVVQRALLQIVQQKFDDAIRVLDEFVQRYQNDPNSAQTVQDAYLYEAYAYFAKKEFERALLLVEQMERSSEKISPETALLKIKLLVALNRVDEAETLLNVLESSSYGQETPDAIASYRALVSLARGQWDAAISSLTTLLKVRPTSNNAVALNYYNAGATSTGNQLAPHDFVESCGTLILSYASRYAAKKNPADEAAQAAVFIATANYARSLNDPALNLIVEMIDKRRANALKEPIASGSAGVSVATPSGSVATPPNPFANPTVPNASQPPRQGGASYRPRRPGPPGSQAPNAPNDPNAGNANAPNDPNAGNANAPNAGNANAPNDPNAGNANAPNDPNAGNANAPNDAASNESTPLTSVAAREALAKATNFFVNQEYDRANEVLLEAMTSSETFWQDCPAEAARIALLRANVLYALNKRSEAQLMCQELLSNAPHSPESAVAAFYLGYAADLLARRDDAIKYLSLAANSRTVSPLADAALYYLATNEWERRDVERAQQNFTRLYRSYPRSAYWSHAVWALAKIEFDAKNDVVAEELVNEALAKKPDAAIVDHLLFLKGEIALRAKDYDKARVAFEMIIEQYPESVWRSKATNRLNAIPERFRNPSATPSANVASAPSSRPVPPAPRREPRQNADDETPLRPNAPRPTAPNLPPNAFDERRPAGATTNNRTPRPATNRSNDERRPAASQPNAAPSERSGAAANVSRYPAARESRPSRDESRVYRTSFSNETLRF